MAAAVVRLLVLEHIVLIPAHDVHLLVGALVKYRVAKVVRGKMTGKLFPQRRAQFSAELCDSAVDSLWFSEP